MAAPISRRRFLQGASALGAATALGACTKGRDDAARSAPTPAPARPGADGTLVVVTLYGGNDALNTVAPIHDPAYPSLRAGLALDPATVHDIGEGFALHPALTRSKALWDDGRLAVVHGVGFGGLDRSHFHCMDVWQAGGEGDLSTGWIGRWLDVVGTDPLDAVAVGRNLPLLARGQRRSAAVVPAGPFDLPGDPVLHDGLAALAANDDRSPLGDLVARTNADLLSVAATVSPVMADMADIADVDMVGARLDTVATLIDAGIPARAYTVDLGGFDTHAAQPDTHGALLAELDAALGSFLERVASRPVTVLVYSEFGRRVAPNASDGTDHGGAGTVLLAGTVRPGHHGEPPPLDRLADGDLVTTVDFRSVYGAVLEGVLGIEAADILDDAPAPLALI
jgi:uncharacterized protein (DUF1501 family)